MMRYIPFIIISLVLYTLFFYNNQQPELLSVESNQAKIEKIVPLDFKKVAQQDQQPLAATQQLTSIDDPETIQQKTQEITHQTPTELTTETITENKIKSMTTAQAKTDDANMKRMKARLHASIKATLAAEPALLKAEHYELDFHLDLPAPPKPKAKPKKAAFKAPPAKKQVAPVNINDSVSHALLQQTTNKALQAEPTVTSNEKKPKRSFKKQVKSMPQNTGLTLQQAIAVSGNKPNYPEQAKKEKLQGFITVTFIVNMQGKTNSPNIVTSTGHSKLDAAVLDFIEKERFMPALKGIEKVTSKQQFSFSFTLK